MTTPHPIRRACEIVGADPESLEFADTGNPLDSDARLYYTGAFTEWLIKRNAGIEIVDKNESVWVGEPRGGDTIAQSEGSSLVLTLALAVCAVDEKEKG